MRTLLHLPFAFFAKHHGRENLGHGYTEHLYGNQGMTNSRGDDVRITLTSKPVAQSN